MGGGFTYKPSKNGSTLLSTNPISISHVKLEIQHKPDEKYYLKSYEKKKHLNWFYLSVSTATSSAFINAHPSSLYCHHFNKLKDN